jgi:hypothetical protein
VGEKHQKAPCFWCSAQQFGHIVAIFEPVMGDFFEHFSSKGFFDSLVWQCCIVLTLESTTLIENKS